MAIQLADDIPQIIWGPAGEATEQDCACPDDGFKPVLLARPVGEWMETDCACPDDGFAPTRVAPAESCSTWQQASGLYRTRLSTTHQLVFNPLGANGVVVLNEPAKRILDSFVVPLPLNRIPALFPTITSIHSQRTTAELCALGLIQPTCEPPTFIRSQPRTLTAWLHVTNACNLRCTYCYLNKSDEAMDEATGIAAVESIFRAASTHGFRAVKLKYAGGEATLNFRLVRKIHARAVELAPASGIELRAVVLSNGVALTPAMLDYIRDTNMRLMISLDGIGAGHDAQRMFANGRGSYRFVTRGIERALAQGVMPYLSITVTAKNVDQLPAAVAFALDLDLPFNLNFFRNSECAASHAELAADQERLIRGLQAALAVVETRLPQRNLIGALIDRAHFDQPHEYTCGAGHNYLVIDQQGRVARCQMEIERTVGNIWQNDPLHVVWNAPNTFQNIAVDKKEGCRDCTWKYWCAGGCPLLTFKATGRSDVKSPYCHVYQALYPEVLRLEGLRLLKYATANA